jgi:hypothetical protein
MSGRIPTRVNKAEIAHVSHWRAFADAGTDTGLDCLETDKRFDVRPEVRTVFGSGRNRIIGVLRGNEIPIKIRVHDLAGGLYDERLAIVIPKVSPIRLPQFATTGIGAEIAMGEPPPRTRARLPAAISGAR